MFFLGTQAQANPAPPSVLNNGHLRFGDGTTDSVAADGNLRQPFYCGVATQPCPDNDWLKLTYSNYPLDNAIGIDGDGGDVEVNPWNNNGTIVSSAHLTDQVVDYSQFVAGSGTIVSTGTVTIDSKTLQLKNTYELPAGKSFIKITTRITNTSGVQINNVRLWVGTKDDYVAGSDATTKERGKILDGAFHTVDTMAERAPALRISSDGSGVLFYSTSSHASTATNAYGEFSVVYGTNPQLTPISTYSDGSYALFVRMNDLEPGHFDELTWYYAAGDLASLDGIVGDVSDVAQGPTSFTVTSTAAAGGAISPATISVTSGATTGFTVTPAAGYSIGTVEGCAGTLAGSTFTTGAITSACTVSATFNPIDYAVTASAGEGGSISPANVSKHYQDTASFDVSPASGYSIAAVTGCGGTLSGRTYTVASITGACSVSASFALTQPVFSFVQPGAPEGSGTSQPEMIELNSTQLFTGLPPDVRPKAYAFDGTQLDVTLVDPEDRYIPGDHVLTWQTTDSRGAVATVQQTIRVWPIVSFGPDMTIGGQAGNSDHFRIALNGMSPVYPFTVNFTASGDLQGNDLQSGQVTFEKGDVEKEVGFAVLEDMPAGAADRHVQLTLQGEGNIDSHPLTVTITAANKAPTVALTVLQEGMKRPSVARDGGQVTITADIHDPNSGDEHTSQWSGPSGAVFTTLGDSITIDPSSLPVGVHRFELTVTDNGMPPIVSHSTFELVVTETAQALPQGATAFLPSGLPNHPDYAPAAPNVLPEKKRELSHHVMESEPGTKLALGSYAALQGEYQTGVPGTLAGSNLSADSVSNVGGYFDFVVTDMPVVGASVNVVIPQRAAIPAQPIYRKFDNATGSWHTFFEDEGNQLASAPGEDGFCPPPASEAYVAGLHAGDWCVRLTIRDGGPNDTDGQQNGSVADPGGVGSLSTVVVTGESHGKDGGGGSFDAWMLLAGLGFASLRILGRQRRWAVLAGLAALSGNAMADEEHQWYAGATFGQARSDVSAGELTRKLEALGYDATATVDDETRSAWRVHAGYQWNRYLALEAGYVDLGDIDTRFSGSVADVAQFLADTNSLHPVSANGFDLAMIGRYEFGSRVAVNARMGSFFWKTDIRTDNASVQTVKRDDSGVDGLVGIGADINLYRGLSLNVEGTRYGIGGDHIDFIGAGITWRWQ
jgi:hypothetical protein